MAPISAPVSDAGAAVAERTGSDDEILGITAPETPLARRMRTTRTTKTMNAMNATTATNTTRSPALRRAEEDAARNGRSIFRQTATADPSTARDFNQGQTASRSAQDDNEKQRRDKKPRVALLRATKGKSNGKAKATASRRQRCLTHSLQERQRMRHPLIRFCDCLRPSSRAEGGTLHHAFAVALRLCRHPERSEGSLFGCTNRDAFKTKRDPSTPRDKQHRAALRMTTNGVKQGKSDGVPRSRTIFCFLGILFCAKNGAPCFRPG
jgi:hypothetical protein